MHECHFGPFDLGSDGWDRVGCFCCAEGVVCEREIVGHDGGWIALNRLVMTCLCRSFED